MAKSWNRTETWVAVVVVAVGLVPAAIMGVLTYLSTTAPVHPDPENVPSVSESAPLPMWADAADRARQIVHAALLEENLPGLSVAVGVDGAIVWAEGFGLADLEGRIPVTPATTFRLGTASTVLTSAAAGLLLEDGRLKLDEVVQTHVPEFSRTYTTEPPGQPWQVTLAQVMGHTSGIPNDGGDEGALFASHCARPADALQHFSGYERQLRFEAGTHYLYSRYGWILVSAAIEAAAGEPFLTFMRDKVFEPLGMDNTAADSTAEPVPNKATSYFPRFAADPGYGQHLMRPLDFSCYAGSSQFVSTPSDLVRFAMAIERGAILKPATVQLLQTSQRLASGEETGYGLGWDLETVTLAGSQTRVAGIHGDVLGGTMASLMMFPEHGITVAVLSNISYADTPGVALRVAEVFAGQRSAPRQ